MHFILKLQKSLYPAFKVKRDGHSADKDAPQMLYIAICENDITNDVWSLTTMESICRLIIHTSCVRDLCLYIYIYKL